MIQKLIFLNQKPKEDNYKPVRIGNAFSSNYIEYKSSVNKDKSLSMNDYLDETKPCLSDKINDHKTEDECKIHLTIAIFFLLHSKSDNIEILIANETDEFTEDVFDSF